MPTFASLSEVEKKLLIAFITNCSVEGKDSASEIDVKTWKLPEIPAVFRAPMMHLLGGKSVFTIHENKLRPTKWTIHPSFAAEAYNAGLKLGLYNAVGSIDQRGPQGNRLVEDSSWEPLPLERGTKKEELALESTEKLLERVRGDNGFAQSDPTKHEAVVWSLATGLEAIKRRSPSRDQLGSLLLRPMRWLSEKFMSSAIGELAKTALKHIMDWIN